MFVLPGPTSSESTDTALTNNVSTFACENCTLYFAVCTLQCSVVTLMHLCVCTKQDRNLIFGEIEKWNCAQNSGLLCHALNSYWSLLKSEMLTGSKKRGQRSTPSSNYRTRWPQLDNYLLIHVHIDYMVWALLQPPRPQQSPNSLGGQYICNQSFKVSLLVKQGSDLIYLQLTWREMENLIFVDS